MNHPCHCYPMKKIEYWPQLLLSTETGKAECCSPKLWCTQTGWLYQKKKKEKVNDGSSLLPDQLSCLSLFQSYCHSFTVNLAWHKLGMRPNKPFPLIPSSFLLAHFFWWGVRVNEAIERMRVENVHVNFALTQDREQAVSDRIAVRSQRCCQLKMTESTVWGDIQLAERCAKCSWILLYSLVQYWKL